MKLPIQYFFINRKNIEPALFFLYYYVCWAFYFLIQRLIFVIYFHHQFQGLKEETILQSFIFGLPLDLSMAGYFAAIPLLLLIVQQFTPVLFFKKTVKIYTWILIVLTSLISIADLGIYENWGVKLNYRAVAMLIYPAEALESAKSAPLLLLLLLMLMEVVVAGFLFQLVAWNKIKPLSFRSSASQKIIYAVQKLLIAGVIVLSIRGGWQQIPINESVAYFSSNPFINHAAVNTSWHLSSSILKNRRSGQENIYLYLSPGEAAERTNQFYRSSVSDSTQLILNRPRPNIVFIQLESFTADVIEELGGVSGVSPNLSRIISEGILFTNIYASGVRTDQGIIALLAGFPAQPQTSIVNQPEKLERMPFLSLELKKANYKNSFYYGGDMRFGRFNTIAHCAGFDHIVGLDDFSNAGLFNKWGADDKSLFDKYIVEMQHPEEPFFSYIITSSSHEPFTVPMPTVFTGETDGEQFKNACYFTDQSLGDFFEAVKQTTWYKNTLFVLVADHGSNLPAGRTFYEPARYHIPLIFFGEVLKEEFLGKKINSMGSQTDIATTLLKQLQLPSTAFKWGNDLLNLNRSQFAFYTFDDGFGWLTEKDTFLFDNRAKRLLPSAHKTENTTTRNATLWNGKAYMQSLYDAFLKY